MNDAQDEMRLAVLEPVDGPGGCGAVDGEDSKNFTYYPINQTRTAGKVIDYFHLQKPNARKLKNNRVSISDTMGIDQMENMIAASICRVICADDEELPSSKFRDAILSLEFDDIIKLFNEVQTRFLAALTA